MCGIRAPCQTSARGHPAILPGNTGGNRRRSMYTSQPLSALHNLRPLHYRAGALRRMHISTIGIMRAVMRWYYDEQDAMSVEIHRMNCRFCNTVCRRTCQADADPQVPAGYDRQCAVRSFAGCACCYNHSISRVLRCFSMCAMCIITFASSGACVSCTASAGKAAMLESDQLIVHEL